MFENFIEKINSLAITDFDLDIDYQVVYLTLQDFDPERGGYSRIFDNALAIESLLDWLKNSCNSFRNSSFSTYYYFDDFTVSLAYLSSLM